MKVALLIKRCVCNFIFHSLPVLTFENHSCITYHRVCMCMLEKPNYNWFPWYQQRVIHSTIFSTPNKDSTTSVVVSELMETDNKDVLYSENYLVALHITIMFIALERKTQTVAAKKNTPVFFCLCKDTVVCFWIYFDKPQAHEAVSSNLYSLKWGVAGSATWTTVRLP